MSCYKKMRDMSKHKQKASYFISNERLLNKLGEIISQCRHEKKHNLAIIKF